MKIPVIKSFSEKLLLVCLSLIGSYLVFIVAYLHFSLDPLKHLVALDMLHSAILAAVVSLGGGLLLDCEIRQAENKSRY